ncbi:alpha-galactosidase [Micromonospora sp. LOL_024]|uniref:alpha-galactosidase n=1 Tax=Micromonospora sp. LOL_024 TaxID=3345412 RepID=UPI003A87D15B
MLVYLRAAGASLVLDARGAYPVVVHWGRDLDDLNEPSLAALADAAVPAVPSSALDVPLRLSLLPTVAQGWSGRPAISGHRRDEGGSVPDLRLVQVQRSATAAVLDLKTKDGRLRLTTDIELTRQGVLRVRHRLRNEGADDFQLASLDVLLPVPTEASEILDFTGVWAYERRPQRTRVRDGLWSRESRHGRPGHNDAFLMMVGTPGFGFRSGRIWAAHLAWSGDKRSWVERHPLGHTVLGCGELLTPGEMRLAPGEQYATPWAVTAWSDSGIDGLSSRLHAWIRDIAPARRPAPVVLNTWEAVYFDHDADRLDRLVDLAAEVGVERFVLDDGWFTGRRDPRRALGDWYVDQDRWPAGLGPLVDRVHQRGMDFGLWVEPEMVSPDSRLARAHPEWVLGPSDSPTWRWQRVLDLTHPDAYAYVLQRLTALLTEYPIGYLKWDHNRDLLHEGATHRQTKAVYRLLAALRDAFAHLHIESCASGGARIDLGILPLVDRVWASDNNDPLERQRIQRWTSVLVPLEYLGGHLGDTTAHITGRASDLSFRLATALLGNAGVEWDLTRTTPNERADIARWIVRYKQLRHLLHTGTLVRADDDRLGRYLYGVVDAHGDCGVYVLATLAPPESGLPAPLRFPGLEPQRRYTVRPLPLGPPVRTVGEAAPAWLRSGGVTLPGRVLAEVGLPAPLLAPAQAMLYSAEADG